MKVLSVFNIKGGVGKTATSVNLAWLSARDGARTLLWDLDPQGAATFYFRIKPKVRGGGNRLIRGKSDPMEAVRGTDFPDLDLLPADLSYREMSSTLAREEEGSGRLREVLEPLAEHYDRVFLDCAPNLSEISDAIFTATDTLLVPTVPTTLSLRTLAQLMKYLKREDGPRPEVLPFFSLVDRRKALHRRVCEYVRAEGLGFLEAEIPYSSTVEKMGLSRNPVFEYARRDPAVRAYEALWSEVLAHHEGRGNTEAVYRKSTRKALQEAARKDLGNGRR